MIAADVSDFRALARRRLPRFLFEYIDGGSYAETTLRRNVDDLQALMMRQRVMRDVSQISLATTLLGRAVTMPVALAPIGLAGLYARRGEVQAARAARTSGVPFTLSTVSVCSLEEVRRAVDEPFWMQLYMIKDRGFMADLLARAKAAGLSTLFMTVDLPVNGARYRDVRSGLSGSQGLWRRVDRLAQVAARPRWAWDVGVRGTPHNMGNVAAAMPPGTDLFKFFEWVGKNFDPSVTWADLDWLRQHWSGKLVIKGVLEPEDAKAALAVGADGVVVSNHGGRQLDGAPSTIAALPPIVEAVGGRMTVLLDSGVRSGLDVLRAVALGADGVLIGRAWAWALAARGETGVQQMLEVIRKEMAVAMALLGVSEISAVDHRCIATASSETRHIT